MAISITDVHWKREQRSVSFNSGVFTITEMLQVFTDLPADPGATVTSDPLFFIGDAMFPAIGSQHPENSGLRFENIGQATQMEENKSVWMFPLIYTSRQPDVTDQSGDSNYEEDEFVNASIASKSWSFKSIKIPRRPSQVSDDGGTTYSTGSLLTSTTAGEPINSSETKYLPVLNYVRNELAVPASILSFVGSVNSDVVTLDGVPVAADTALVSDIKVSPWKRDQASEFRTVTYTFILKDDLWGLELINRGFYIKDVAPDGPQIAELPAGPGLKETPVTTPQLLKFTPGSGATDLAKFLSSKTELLDLKVDGPGSYHTRTYLHPQRTAFTGYGFS